MRRAPRLGELAQRPQRQDGHDRHSGPIQVFVPRDRNGLFEPKTLLDAPFHQRSPVRSPAAGSESGEAGAPERAADALPRAGAAEGLNLR